MFKFNRQNIDKIRRHRPWIPESTVLGENGALIDKIDFPFVDDADVHGYWTPCDMVRKNSDFNSNKTKWKHGYHIEFAKFNPDGVISYVFTDIVAGVAGRWITNGDRWTKNIIICAYPVVQEIIACHYEVTAINQEPFLFMDWKTGDYIYRYMKPWICVFRRAVEAEVKKYDENK